MYGPHFYIPNLDRMLSGAPLDTAIGVPQAISCCVCDIKSLEVEGRQSQACEDQVPTRKSSLYVWHFAVG